MAKNKLYSRYTICLVDVLVEYPNLLDNLQLRTPEQTEKFIEKFKARWNIYEIGGETIAHFKLFVENKFNEIKDYYQDLIDAYYQDIDYLEGIKDTTEIEHIDLPNKQTTLEYISSKDRHIRKGGYTAVQLKVMYMKQLRDIYKEMADKFQPCFLQLFGTYGEDGGGWLC